MLYEEVLNLNKTIKSIFQFRRNNALTWQEKNPILAIGEPGFEINTNKLKIGDGISDWNTLDYVATGE